MQLVIIILTILIKGAVSQPASPSVESWFDTQYDDAMAQCKEQEGLIEEVFKNTGIDQDFGLAVAFPEMLRYALWRDVFETKALQMGYVQSGKESVDFSIGWLQIKPSFVEELEKQMEDEEFFYSEQIVGYKASNLTTKRKARIERLKDFKWQLIYLSAFIHNQRQYLMENNIPDNEHLALMAAAYNYGQHRSIKELRAFNELKAFPYGLGKDNPFSFAQISTHFYSKQLKTR